VVVSICPTLLTPVDEIVLEMADCYHTSQKSKPLVVEIQEGADCDTAILGLRRCGIPAYPTPERAVAAFSMLRRYTLQRIELMAEQGERRRRFSPEWGSCIEIRHRCLKNSHLGRLERRYENYCR
jgi:acyl-CoA synthetase (NDP forming)